MRRTADHPVAMVAAAVLTGALSVAWPVRSGPAACSAPAYRDFDFWVGDWWVSDFGKPHRDAMARVIRVQGGCGVREDFLNLDGTSGESLNFFDPTSAGWRQTWVSSRGAIVVLNGSRRDGVMTLEGEQSGAAAPLRVRGVWAPSADGVRETAWRSADGKAWQPWFDISFHRLTSRVSQTR
jgi:hypothetical protein